MGPRRPSHRVLLLVLVLLASGLLRVQGAQANAQAGPGLAVPGGVAVLDAGTGEELWAVSPKESKNLYVAVPGRNVVVTTKGTCDSTTDSFDATGLVVFDAATGRKRWETSSAVGGYATVRPQSTYVYGVVPVDAQGVVVTDEPTGPTGRRAADGKVMWSRPATDAVMGVSEVSVFTGAEDGSLRVVARDSGRVRWERGDGLGPYTIVAADERHVVLATGEIQSQPYGHVTFVVLEAPTGRERSRFDAGHPEVFDFTEVALTDRAVVYAQRSSIVSRRVSDGEQNWRQRVDKDPGPLGMARSNDNKTVFALRSGLVGRVVALDATTGRERWDKTGYLAAPGSTTAILGPSSTSRALRSVDAASGTSEWRYVVPADSAPIGTGALKRAIAGGRLALSTDCTSG